jgi:hypothetical protein
MRYRLTPFHLASLYFLYETVYCSIIWARDGDKVELGALFPFIYFGLLIMTLLVDLLVQFTITGFSKASWKVLYLVETLLIVLILIYVNKTVHAG